MMLHTPGPDGPPSGAAGCPATTAPQFSSGYGLPLVLKLAGGPDRDPKHRLPLFPLYAPLGPHCTPSEFGEFGSSTSSSASLSAADCPFENARRFLLSTLLVMLAFRKIVRFT